MLNSSRRWSWGLLPLVFFGFVLGCAGQEGIAQEDPQETPKETPKEEAPAAVPAKKKQGGEAKKKEDDPGSYWAKVKDKNAKSGKPFVVRSAVLFVPEVSLFGGGGGKEVKFLELKRGSAVIKIPFSRIKMLTMGIHKEDRLPLTVTLRDVAAEDSKLEGSVKASLELRGTLGNKDLATIVKLREAETIELNVEPEKK